MRVHVLYFDVTLMESDERLSGEVGEACVHCDVTGIKTYRATVNMVREIRITPLYCDVIAIKTVK